MEKDPSGKDPNKPGAKLDFGKPKIVQAFIEQFPRAMIEVSKVTEFGAVKYTWNGWKTVDDGTRRYLEASTRHILKRPIEGEYDKESNLYHLAHCAWNAMAALELFMTDLENKDNI